MGGRLSLDVQHDLRTEVFGALHRLDGASQDELNTGQVVSRSISDITLVQGLLSFLPMMTGNVLLFVISLVIMLVLSPLLTLVAVAVGPALWFIAIRSRRRLFPATWAAQQQAGDLAGRRRGCRDRGARRQGLRPGGSRARPARGRRHASSSRCGFGPCG